MMADSKHLKQEQQNASTTTMDIISTLPDSILCHILSFLPTKHSVATGVLSRRWRHLWEYLQVFDFDSSGYNCQLQLKRFSVFVYSVLALRKMRDIRKFRLTSGGCCSDADDDCMAKWIRAAVGPHLQQLDLSLFGPYQYEFRLPHGLFTCTGLVSLTLWGSIGLEEEQLVSVNLPSLKTLNLDIDVVNPINQLLSGCPVLETLNLSFTVSNAPKIRVPSSLKSFSFVDETIMEIEHLEIDTPSLEYLSIEIRTKCSQFSVINLGSVVEAHVYFEKPRFQGEYDHIDLVLNLLKGLTRTKYLHLYRPTIECLLNTPVVDFPKFGFLIRLNLTLPYVNPKFLVNLLKKCALLQDLEIWDDKKSMLPLGKWIKPRNVPKCLRLHLINVAFQGYRDCANERAFMTYILKRGLVLKTVKIHTADSLRLEKKHRILKKLSTIPRGSSMCQLNFH